MVKALAVASLVALAACSTTPGDFCSTAKPISLTDSTVDRMTESEVNQVLAHNRTGAKLCKWRAR